MLDTIFFFKSNIDITLKDLLREFACTNIIFGYSAEVNTKSNYTPNCIPFWCCKCVFLHVTCITCLTTKQILKLIYDTISNCLHKIKEA